MSVYAKGIAKTKRNEGMRDSRAVNLSGLAHGIHNLGLSPESKAAVVLVESMRP